MPDHVVSPEEPFRLAIPATAQRQLGEELPEAVAFAAYACISGSLLANPLRVGNRLMPPLDDRAAHGAAPTPSL